MKAGQILTYEVVLENSGDIPLKELQLKSTFAKERSGRSLGGSKGADGEKQPGGVSGAAGNRRRKKVLLSGKSAGGLSGDNDAYSTGISGKSGADGGTGTIYHSEYVRTHGDTSPVG